MFGVCLSRLYISIWSNEAQKRLKYPWFLVQSWRLTVLSVEKSTAKIPVHTRCSGRFPPLTLTTNYCNKTSHCSQGPGASSRRFGGDGDTCGSHFSWTSSSSSYSYIILEASGRGIDRKNMESTGVRSFLSFTSSVQESWVLNLSFGFFLFNSIMWKSYNKLAAAWKRVKPIASMYSILTYIYHTIYHIQPKAVGRYTIHGWMVWERVMSDQGNNFETTDS